MPELSYLQHQSDKSTDLSWASLSGRCCAAKAQLHGDIDHLLCSPWERLWAT